MAQVELLRQCGRPLWEEGIALNVFFYGARPNADLDNLLKSVFDALSGVVIDDDIQVRSVWAVRRKGTKRTVIEATKLPEE